jgi:hypothetical protein
MQLEETLKIKKTEAEIRSGWWCLLLKSSESGLG